MALILRHYSGSAPVVNHGVVLNLYRGLKESSSLMNQTADSKIIVALDFDNQDQASQLIEQLESPAVQN